MGKCNERGHWRSDREVSLPDQPGTGGLTPSIGKSKLTLRSHTGSVYVGDFPWCRCRIILVFAGIRIDIRQPEIQVNEVTNCLPTIALLMC